jgi:UDP-N-acetylmuramate-alanine ligase
MVATLLEAGGLDPTVINGGIINAYGTNARMGEGEWMVVEADESDGTFLKLPAEIAVVTNIDPEHLDHYGTFDAVREAFPANSSENVPFYGFGVMCLDHPEVQAWSRGSRTAGSSPMARTRRPMCAISTTAWTGRFRCSIVVINAARPARRLSEGSAAADARPAQCVECDRRDCRGL